MESADIGVLGAKARLANLRRKLIMREKRLSICPQTHALRQRASISLAGADLTGQVPVEIRQVVGSNPTGARRELLPDVSVILASFQ